MAHHRGHELPYCGCLHLLTGKLISSYLNKSCQLLTMRLYNAASCTPCSTAWDVSASKTSKPGSFAPEAHVVGHGKLSPAASKICSPDNSTDEIYDNEQADGGRHNSVSIVQNTDSSRYQYLLKIPSNTTKETLLFDNTSQGSFTASGDRDTRNGERMEDNKHQLPASSNRRMPRSDRGEKSNQHLLTYNGADHKIQDYYYGKFMSEGKEEFSTGAYEDDDAESSCSTLTTTRSMLLQQQDCAVTVNSLSYSHKTSKSDEEVLQRPVATDSEYSALLQNREISVSRIENVKADLHVETGIDGEGKCEERTYPLDSPCAVAKSNDGSSIPARQPTTSSRDEATALISSPRTPKPQAKPACKSWVPSGTNSEGDNFLAVKSRLKRVPITDNARLEEERIELFPKKRSPDGTADRKHSPSRLGVTCNFPSAPKNAPTSNICEHWDPLHEKTDSVNKEETWEGFGIPLDPHQGDLVPSQSSASDESPFPFDMMVPEKREPDFSGTPLLLETGQNEYERPATENSDEVDALKPECQGKSKQRDIRKLLAKGGGRAQRRLRRDFLQGPKLLGPMLESRFTKSYWRRLQHQQNNEAAPSQSLDDKVFLSQSSSGCQLEGKQSGDSFEFNAEDIWWESSGSSGNEVDHSGRPAEAEAQTFEVVNAEFRGQLQTFYLERVQACESFLQANNAQDHGDLLASIDAADTSGLSLTLEHIFALKSLVPTREEEGATTSYQTNVRDKAIRVTSTTGEKFIAAMAGINELKQKLEALEFQLEFPKAIDKIFAGKLLVLVLCKWEQTLFLKVISSLSFQITSFTKRLAKK